MVHWGIATVMVVMAYFIGALVRRENHWVSLMKSNEDLRKAYESRNDIFEEQREATLNFMHAMTDMIKKWYITDVSAEDKELVVDAEEANDED